MTRFGAVLRRLLDRQGVTQSALADAVGVQQSAVSKWVAGLNMPNGPTRRAIAKALGMTLDDLDAMWDAPSVRSEVRRHAGIPLVNKTAAGYNINYDLDHYDEYGAAWEFIDRGDVDDPLAFAVRVVEDSMEPRINEGDILVLRPVTDDAGSPELRPGAIVLVRLGPAAPLPNQATIAQWRPRSDGTVLLAKINPVVEPLLVRMEDIERVAVAVELRSKLR